MTVLTGVVVKRVVEPAVIPLVDPYLVKEVHGI